MERIFESLQATAVPPMPLLQVQNNLLEYAAGPYYMDNFFAEYQACQMCDITTGMVRQRFFNQVATERAMSLGIRLCHIVSPFWQRRKHCPSFVKKNFEDRYKIFGNEIFSKDRICNEALGVCHVPIIRQITDAEGVAAILKDKPADLDSDDYHQKLHAEMKKKDAGRETFKVVHIADVHVDPKYTEGSLANCGNLLCCQADSGEVTRAWHIPAGPWGMFGDCDIPMRTFHSLMDYLGKEVDADMLIWTGDNTSHALQSISQQETNESTIFLTEILREAAEEQQFTVLPIFGNHDVFPSAEQDFRTPNTDINVNIYKDYWAPWLTPEALDKFGEYGYYSMPIKELASGKVMPDNFWAIGINSNACAPQNPYILAQRNDPGGQLAWLEAELLKIEELGGMAYIYSHYNLPLCQHQWGVRYRALMERFQHVVRLGFQGHDHRQLFNTSQSITHPGKAVVYNNVAGSVETLYSVNPQITVLEVDTETMLPIDITVHSFDLKEANAAGKDVPPNWHIIYSMKEEYGLDDVSPQTMLELSKRVDVDKDLAAQFEWNMYGQARVVPEKPNAHKWHCYTASTDMHEYNACMKDGELGSPLGKPYGLLSDNGILDRIFGNWIVKEYPDGESDH